MADQFMDSMKKIHPYHIERLQYICILLICYMNFYILFLYEFLIQLYNTYHMFLDQFYTIIFFIIRIFFFIIL